MRAVLVNTPWARSRLGNMAKWWGLEFVFDVVEVNLPFVPMQEHPTAEGLAVLDMGFVSRWKQGFTLFVAPYDPVPRRPDGTTIERRAPVMGIFLPPALSLTRWEWFFTRLFWDSPVIEVFANETDQTWSNGVALGAAFELWAEHEFSHWLYWAIGRGSTVANTPGSPIDGADNTHPYFYEGEPALARTEVMRSFQLPLPKKDPQPAPARGPDYIQLWAEAIQEFEGWVPPGGKYRDGAPAPSGSASWRNNNPGNIRGASGAFLRFDTAEDGFAYLKQYLSRACTGAHKAYSPQMTVDQAMHVYTSDDEPVPTNYAKFCAMKMGVPVTRKIGTLA